jgi:CysZ protein
MWFERRRRERPGIFRRAAAGAWHVPAGFVFLARSPGLWPLAILPAVLAVACILGGFFLGLFAIPLLEKTLVPGEGKIAERLGFLLTLALWIGTLIAGMILGLAVALLLSSPILERISRQVEARVRGEAVEHHRGLGWEMLQSFKGSMYFVFAAPVALLLGLVPLVGPVAGTLWGAHALAFQQTDVPLARRGRDFRARRSWHRRYLAESMGFGLAGLVTLLIPVLNLLIGPALAAGGTLLVIEFEEGVPAPEPAGPAAEPPLASPS